MIFSCRIFHVYIYIYHRLAYEQDFLRFQPQRYVFFSNFRPNRNGKRKMNNSPVRHFAKFRIHLPSGYLTVCHGKSTNFDNGKPSISMGDGFHGELLVITRPGTYIYGLILSLSHGLGAPKKRTPVECPEPKRIPALHQHLVVGD